MEDTELYITSVTFIDPQIDLCDTFFAELVEPTTPAVSSSTSLDPAKVSTIEKRCQAKKSCAAKCMNVKGKTLHKFPPIKYFGKDREENLHRCKEWIKFSGNKNLLAISPRQLHDSFFLCSDHFKDDQFTSSARKRLLMSAVPNVITCPFVAEEDLNKFPKCLAELEKSVRNGNETSAAPNCDFQMKLSVHETTACMPKLEGVDVDTERKQSLTAETCQLAPSQNDSSSAEEEGNDTESHCIPTILLAVPPKDTNGVLLAVQQQLKSLYKQVHEYSGSQKDEQFLFLDRMLTQELSKLDTMETNKIEALCMWRKALSAITQQEITKLEAKITATNNSLSSSEYDTGTELSCDEVEYSETKPSPKCQQDQSTLNSQENQGNPDLCVPSTSQGNNGTSFNQNCQVVNNIVNTKKPVIRKVCSANCQKTRNQKLHTFPAIFFRGRDREGNLQRCKNWIKISGNRSLLDVHPRELSGRYFLCSAHFSTDQYYNCNRDRLMQNAVPNIATCQTLKDEDIGNYALTLEALNKLDNPATYKQGHQSILEHNVVDKTVEINKDNSTTENSSNSTGPENSTTGASNGNGAQDLNNNTDEHQKTFESVMNSFEWRTCRMCKERFFTPKNSEKRCNHTNVICRLLSDANDMDPGEVPEELQGLSYAEEQLISRIRPILTIYKINKKQFGYSGSVINFPQDVREFAQKLPHHINDLTTMITVRTKKMANDNDTVKYKDFQVRAGFVKRALLWLQKNNPYYFDIDISEENLASIPQDGNIYDLLKSVESNDTAADDDSEDFESDEENDKKEDTIEETSIPLFRPPPEKDQIKNVVGWPTTGKEPVDEFNTIGYIAQAFPCLFPYGKADLRAQRNQKVKETLYFQHLMNYLDQRFSRHSRFRFFALNSLMRWTALHDGGIFVQRFPEFKDMTVDDLKKKLQEDPNLIKRIMFQGNNIRGTKAYWYAKGKELQAMIEQLKLPTIFLTMSAADFHWPELFKLLAPDEDLTTMSDWRRQQIVIENPMIVDQFFMERVDSFLKEVLKNKYKVKDYWFRIEYQHRGSPH